MCHNKHSHFALTDIVHSGYCGLAISICVWQHTVAKTEVLKQASWLPCRNTRQSVEHAFGFTYLQPIGEFGGGGLNLIVCQFVD